MTTEDAVDPRITRTRRDVVGAAADLLVEQGWGAVGHAEVARRAGYAKATVYAHWPTRLDLVAAAVDRICDVAEHPRPTGDLRADLVAGLTDFAQDLSGGPLVRILGGVLERAGTDPVVDELRRRLHEAGTSVLRGVLRAHLAPEHVEPALALLVGGVFVQAAFAGEVVNRPFVEDLVDRVLKST